MEEKRITKISEDEYLKLFDTPREIKSGFTIYKVFTSNNMLAFPEEWGSVCEIGGSRRICGNAPKDLCFRRISYKN